MQAELTALENKLGQLLQLARRLREENHRLRQELASSQSLERKSEDKIASVSKRLETLLAKLPEDLIHDE